MNAKTLLMASAAIEIGAGLALIVMPATAALVLLGAPLDSSTGLAVGRLAGAALLSLAIACWLARDDGDSRAAMGLVTAMLVYNCGAVAVLANAGWNSGLAVVILWLAVLLHAGMAVWCAAILTRTRRTPKRFAHWPKVQYRQGSSSITLTRDSQSPGGFMRLRTLTSNGVVLIAAAGLICLMGGDARAQQSGHNIPGDAGLHSGSQAPPGIYVGNVYYTYPTSKLAGDDGDKVNRDGRVRTTIDSVFVNWVTTKKFLGANIGGQVAVPIIKNRIEAFSLDASSDLGFSDIYVQPINLGWHFKRADVIASYGVYMPTGDYKAGAAGNTGLGMFSHELSLGSTVYLNETKMWHASALFQYEMHARKPGIDVKVGDLVTIEGGVGKTFVKMIPEKGPLVTNIGVAAYTQFKATADSGLGISPVLLGRKDRVFAVGPEFNVYIPQLKGSIGVRYLPEFGARNTTQGQTLVITFAYQAKSWMPPHPAPPPPAAAPAGN